MDKQRDIVAFFSMEIYLADVIKNYAGGLGILAGDILRSAADVDFPLVGITLLNSQGYFEQKINLTGEQETSASQLDLNILKKLAVEIPVAIGTDQIMVGVWEYLVKGERGAAVPVYLLDTNLPANKPEDRELTSRLYGGDLEYQLKQEIILGRGGVKLLKALGYTVKKYHLNEGHSVFAALELFNESALADNQKKLEAIKRQCVFTTHTSINGAQSIFSLELIKNYQRDWPDAFPELIKDDKINLTDVGIYFSDQVNAVSLSHQKVVAKIFPDRNIAYVTNGVHSTTWTTPQFQTLYDKYLPGWRQKNSFLKNVTIIPNEEIWAAHQSAKINLLGYINQQTGLKWSENVLTIAYARRMATYKRPELLFYDLKRLLEIQIKHGKLQIIYAGKAHPQDEAGKKLIKDIYTLKNKYVGRLEICFLENYDAPVAKLLTGGADLWLNTPLLNNEASGTSGMKAAHNGVPQLSTLDGWWEEGYVAGQTGWLIKDNEGKERQAINQADAASLYEVLEKEILPAYYHNQERWQDIMRSTISLNASRFNTERVLSQYAAIYNLSI